jgi:hypothetical protein
MGSTQEKKPEAKTFVLLYLYYKHPLLTFKAAAERAKDECRNFPENLLPGSCTIPIKHNQTSFLTLF